ncbi:GYF domain containing proteins [Phaffia rhodozyma]|uniref:GYF domain containing proteins n=1 Tax=Phaffia rhodozyma TaxID=264483 RepID=A0A0F7SRX1_PHARH|nr:GYF domain containing proteins [Phaffia rhodozyma]
MSTTPSTEIHFGPSWMLNSNRKSTLKSQPPTPAMDDHPQLPSVPSYSSIIREPVSTSASHTSQSQQQQQQQAASASEVSLHHVEDPARPFRYTRDFILGLWDGPKVQEANLPIEFERYDVVFQEEAVRPIAFAETTDKERKLFSLPFNPDRRPQATPQSSSNDIQKSELSNRRSRPGESRLTSNAASAFAPGSGSLNSPGRERFSGIQGGVLGGLGASGAIGGVGLGATDGRLGAIGRGERVRRNVSGGSTEPAVLPPSSQNSWRPTRQMSSNLLPQADELPTDSTAGQSTPGRKWRTTTAPSGTPTVSGAAEDEDANLAPGSGERGGGFGAAARPGGWRERERIKKAEGELSSGAGWNTVGKEGDSKRDPNSTPLEGSPTATNFESNTTNNSNAYAALQQDGDASFIDPEQVADAQESQPSIADLEKEAMAKVMWTYKDPTGAVQGPFSAQHMQEWHAQGYFPPSLLVKRETDNVYETVATLTLLAPDEASIFFQRAPVPPAPPGLLPTPGFSPTPLVSPIHHHAYNVQDPIAAANLSAGVQPAHLEMRSIDSDPLEQFLAQRSAMSGNVDQEGRWGAKDVPSRHQLAPHLAQQFAPGPGGSGFQQVLSPGGGFEQGGPLGYGHRSTAPRHLAFNDLGVFQQSPYASPIAQHAQPSPWNQHAQPRYFGPGDQGPAGGVGAGAGFGYQPINQLAPGAGWGNQLNAALQAQAQAQAHAQAQQQQAPRAWGSPAPQAAQPVALQQQVSNQASAQASPVSQWAKPLSQLSISSPAPAASEVEPTPIEAVESVNTPTPAVAAVENEAEVVSKTPVPAKKTVPTPAEQTETKEEATPNTPAPVEKVTPTPSAPATPASVTAASVTAERSSGTASPVPKVAPWARIDDDSASALKPASPGPSLREIQESEARRAAAAKAARPASTVATTLSAPSSTATSVGIPSSGTPPPVASGGPVWQTAGAQTGATPAPARTLKQIQEEEQKQKQKAAAARQAMAMAMGGSAAAKAAYAGALAHAGSAANSNASGAWSTVGTNGKAVPGASKPVSLPSSVPPRPPTQSTTKSVIQSSSGPISGVSSASAGGSAASVAAKAGRSTPASLEDIAPSTEFLTWAKTALKSVTGVNIDEFLQMLLAFPLNPDSAVLEIISDSVYAHSSTLDGRRFATEFVNKRKADAKAQKAGTIPPAGRGSSLADIVKAQPKSVDTGFGAFKVVKKKGKKN